MSSYFRYAAVFRTTLIRSSPKKVAIYPVGIYFFSGPKVLKVPAQTASVLAKDATQPIAHSSDMPLPAGQYVAISVRTDASDPYVAKVFCEDRLDEAIANVSLIHDPALFAHQVYRGWLVEEDGGIAEAWIKIKEPFEIRKDLESILESMHAELGRNADMQARYRLMARFFAKSLLLFPGQDKFFHLWTMLEIYPMTNTTDIRPISDLLASIVERDAPTVKERLGIGPLFGVRSRLVHDGTFSVSVQDLGDVIDRLEAICIEVLREMIGMKYSGSLERYFN